LPPALTPAPTPTPLSVAVLVSGSGTNMQALLDGLRDSAVAHVVRVISSNPKAGALERARKAGVPTAVLADPTDPAEMLGAIGDARLVVLAGYLKRVPIPVVSVFHLRMINIHPALLPSFGGAGMYGYRVHEGVLASGATVSGATIHYVDEEFDHGPVIAQWPVPVHAGDTQQSLAARVLEAEHRLLPAVVIALAERGLPQRPVRLFPAGAAFMAGGDGAITFEA
jgi:phosphoribosylglycinamide formyltransferase-1